MENLSSDDLPDDERRALQAARIAQRDAAAKAVAGMLDAEGFAVVDGTVGFMNVEAGPATLQDVLFEVHRAKRVRVVIIDLDADVPVRRVAQAAGLTAPRRKAQGPQLPGVE